MVCFDLGLSIDWGVITAIGTILMALISFIGIRLSYKAWSEENRPRVIFTIVISDNLYFLKVENIGNKIAYNIKFKVNEEFTSELPDSVIKEKFIMLCDKKIHLASGGYRHYAVSNVENTKFGSSDSSLDETNGLIRKLINVPINISGSYNNGKYKISESFTMNEYTGTYIVSDTLLAKLDRINKSLSEINKSINKKN